MNGYTIGQIAAFFSIVVYLATVLYLMATATGILKRIDKYQSKFGKQVQDLHDWHKPEPDGQQSWKGHRLEEKMGSMDGKIDDLIAVSK